MSAIIFEALASIPQSAQGGGTLPALTGLAFGSATGTYGRGTMPMLTGAGTQASVGIARMPLLRGLGRQLDVGNVGAGRLPLLRGFGSGLPETPDINFGYATVVMLRGAGFARPEVRGDGAGTMPLLRGVGSDAPNFGLGGMPLLTGRAFGVIPPATTPITIIQSAGWLFLEPGTPIYIERMQDALALAAAMSARTAFGLKDSLALESAAQTRATLAPVVADALGLGDTLGVAFLQAIQDALALGDAVSVTLAFAALVDRLVLIDAAPNTLVAYQMLADALVLLDAARGDLILTVGDELALGEQLLAAWSTKIEMLDAITLDAALGGAMTLYCVLPDDLELGADVASVLDAIAIAEDSIAFAMRLYTDDGVYVAYALNTSTRGTSRYLNYPFNSFAEINGRLLGAKPGGLYALEGADDDGEDIPWRLRTGLDNLGTTQLKRMLQAYIGYRSTGQVQLKVITTSPQGAKASYVYDVVAVRATDTRNSTVKIGKGLKSVYWAFQVQGLAGDDFALDTVSIIPLVSGRRVNG